MPDVTLTCVQCNKRVERDDIRQGLAIATRSIAFCPQCAKALTEEERAALKSVSLASAKKTTGKADKSGPESMALRNVVASRLKGTKSQGLPLLQIGVIALVVCLVALIAVLSLL